ncbi:MAG: DUF4233 domain-containing protein [Actinomycetota bacterium]
MLARSVLSMEILLVGFALLLAKDQTSQAGLYFGYFILLLNILALGTLRNKLGWILGWAVQVSLIIYGFYIFMMFFMGALFLALWITAIVVGQKGEAIKRAREGENPQ